MEGGNRGKGYLTMPYSAMEELEIKARLRDRAELVLRRCPRINDEDTEIADNMKDFWKHQSSLAD